MRSVLNTKQPTVWESNELFDECARLTTLLAVCEQRKHRRSNGPDREIGGKRRRKREGGGGSERVGAKGAESGDAKCKRIRVQCAPNKGVGAERKISALNSNNSLNGC
jgi:hypothetical protein